MSNYNPYQINLFNPNHKRAISPNLMKGSFSRQKIGFSKPFPFQSGPKRDITPLRKYNQPVKKNITKKAPSTQLKMEGDLLTATKGSGVNVNNKRANSPFNVVSHRPNINLNANISKNKFGLYKNKNPLINSSKNITNIKPNGNLVQSPNNNGNGNLSKIQNGQVIKTPQNKVNTRSKSNILSKAKNGNLTLNGSGIGTSHNYSFLGSNKKFNHFSSSKGIIGMKPRSETPVPRSKFNLSTNFSFTCSKRIAKSPNRISYNMGSSPMNNNNNLSKKIKNVQNKNYNFSNNHPHINNFKGHNIFKGNFKTKPKTTVITMNMNMNQGDSAINVASPNNSSKQNIIEQPRPLSKIDNGSSTNLQVNDTTNVSKVIPVKEEKPLIPLQQKIQSGIVKKKIRCMHDFSKTGYAGEDEKKVNQDIYFNFRNLANNDKYYFMGVCDGHGAVGQEVSGFLKENLPSDLNTAIKASKKDIVKDDITDIITQTFKTVNFNLSSYEMINSHLSGSTCVSLIYTPYKIITANVGDSRAIMGKQINGKWKSFDLTRDHKPSDPDEKKRILAKGGRIEPMRDDDYTFIGPPRVWLKDEDLPGLAMSRSFGDRVAHSVGVSAEPEIKEYSLTREDKFFIIASDGLFEFISSQEIVDIVKDCYVSHGDITELCENLYKLSRDKWMVEEEVVDDITMIIVFLEDDDE